MEQRYLKISEYSDGDTYRVPYIRMKGKWLASLGFQKGEHITVQVEYGKLIITNDAQSEVRKVADVMKKLERKKQTLEDYLP